MACQSALIRNGFRLGWKPGPCGACMLGSTYTSSGFCALEARLTFAALQQPVSLLRCLGSQVVQAQRVFRPAGSHWEPLVASSRPMPNQSSNRDLEVPMLETQACYATACTWSGSDKGLSASHNSALEILAQEVPSVPLASLSSMLVAHAVSSIQGCSRTLATK